jgi:diguanylate cyclase (GGDEF)-like protein
MFRSVEIPIGKSPAAVTGRRREAVRWHAWLRGVAITLLLFTGLWFGAVHATPARGPVLFWLTVALLMVAGWVCSTRFAIAACVISLAAWSWHEIPRDAWGDTVPGHAVRFVVVLSAVSGLTRLRRQLTNAHRLSRIDALTSLPNRQALIEALEAELGRSRRFSRPFSIVMLDCDGFKQINDVRGHLTGDEVLQLVGNSLRTHTRPFDCAGRWGGDEFLIVLSEVDQEDAQVITERLRAAMRHGVEREFPTITCSLGVVTIRQPPADWQECVRHVDEAMYTAKRLGPDQTRFNIIE